jgi:hypothetical protein
VNPIFFIFESCIHKGINILNSLVKKFLGFSFFLVFLLTISGCTASSNFNIKNLAKSNIDLISELHMDQAISLLKALTEKLYKKNPEELKKNPGQTIESRMEQIFICPIEKKYAELDFKQSTEAILLGFEPEFTGDRIFAVMVGLYTMIHKSYNSKCELFILDYLNEQNLYNSARNIEIFVWRLSMRKKDDGRLIILTNSFEGEIRNLSYERLFGKLISLQDTMARIVSGRTGRIISKAVKIAGMAFLPIGI